MLTHGGSLREGHCPRFVTRTGLATWPKATRSGDPKYSFVFAACTLDVSCRESKKTEHSTLVNNFA